MILLSRVPWGLTQGSKLELNRAKPNKNKTHQFANFPGVDIPTVAILSYLILVFPKHQSCAWPRAEVEWYPEDITDSVPPQGTQSRDGGRGS